jgi:peptidoglycan hydrolase CwlO-like protein
MIAGMKNKILLVTFISVAAFAVGCQKSDDKTAAQQIDKVQTETKQAAQDMQDQLANLNQDLDKLSAKIDSSSDDIKAAARPKLQALQKFPATSGVTDTFTDS